MSSDKIMQPVMLSVDGEEWSYPRSQGQRKGVFDAYQDREALIFSGDRVLIPHRVMDAWGDVKQVVVKFNRRLNMLVVFPARPEDPAHTRRAITRPNWKGAKNATATFSLGRLAMEDLRINSSGQALFYEGALEYNGMLFVDLKQTPEVIYRYSRTRKK